MTIFNEAAFLAQDAFSNNTVALGQLAHDALSPAAWDVGTFLQNATKVIRRWGGFLLILMGSVALVWGGVLLVKKLMAGPQSQGQQSGWGSIALLMVVGGGLATGGWSLVNTIGGGGQKTILDLGKGTILPEHVDAFARILGVG